MLLTVGERIYVKLSRSHIGYARVRRLEGYRFYYDLEEPAAPAPGSWAAWHLLVAGEGRTWCRDTPEEIAALDVARALR